MRPSYGIPNEAIADTLKPYGKVIQIKMDSFHGVYVGFREVQTCFSCHQTCHMTKDCPNHAGTKGNIINADGPLTRVNRPSTSTVPDERIGAHDPATPSSQFSKDDVCLMNTQMGVVDVHPVHQILILALGLLWNEIDWSNLRAVVSFIGVAQEERRERETKESSSHAFDSFWKIV
ncbi:---NA---, partial [Paramuricea clavata]